MERGNRKRSFIGLCVMSLPFDRRSSRRLANFFVFFFFAKKKKNTVKREFTVLLRKSSIVAAEAIQTAVLAFSRIAFTGRYSAFRSF